MDALPEWAAPVAVSVFVLERIISAVLKLKENKGNKESGEAIKSAANAWSNCESARHDAALARISEQLERVAVVLDRVIDKLDDGALRSERLHTETQATINKEVAHTRHTLAAPIQNVISRLELAEASDRKRKFAHESGD